MDFRKATDELLACISHRELADTLGCSVATVRQARLGADALAHRTPPEHWESKVAKLAEQQAAHFRRLAEKLNR
jgi:DNA-binding GntR family transcriptional regulator